MQAPIGANVYGNAVPSCTSVQIPVGINNFLPNTSNNSNQQFSNPLMMPSQFFLPQAQLPKMDLPIFDGDYNKWIEFRDSFHAIINLNPYLVDVQKMLLLRSSLKPDVLETIRSIPVSSQNYALAWKVLADRYERSQLIINNHVNNILKYPNLTKESFKELRQLYNNMFNNIEALRNLSEPIDSWSAILIPIVTAKLDFNSKRQWEKLCSSALNSRKVLKDFFSFLKQRCEVLEKLEAGKSAPDTVKKHEFKGKIRTTGCPALLSSPSCVVCKANHPLYKCKKFLESTPMYRGKIVRYNRLCSVCLKDGHLSYSCTAQKCDLCGKGHNKLLHYGKSKKDSQVSSSFQSQTNQPQLADDGRKEYKSKFRKDNRKNPNDSNSKK